MLVVPRGLQFFALFVFLSVFFILTFHDRNNEVDWAYCG